MEKIRLRIEGMHCTQCESVISSAVKKIPWVEEIKLSFVQGEAQITVKDDHFSKERLLDVINDSGYVAYVIQNEEIKTEAVSLLLLIFFSTLFTLPLVIELAARFFGFSFSISLFWQWLLATVVQFGGGWCFYVENYFALKARSTHRDLLISVAFTLAYGYSCFVAFFSLPYPTYFETSAIIISVALMSRFLESKVKEKASSLLQQLYDAHPQKVHLVGKGNFPIERISIGDKIEILPYEIVPLDCYVLEGSSFVDESALTGEKTAVEKKEGMKLFAASHNQEGVLIAQVSAPLESSLFSQILDFVQESIHSPFPWQKFVEKWVSFFIPLTLMIATATAIFHGYQGSFSQAILATLSVLIIASPVSLALAAPLVILIAFSIGAKNKILIKNCAVLPLAEKIKIIALDNPEILTLRKPKVTDMLSPYDMSQEEALSIAASLENDSDHPIAQALVNAYPNQLHRVEKSSLFPGKGITGTIADTFYAIGSSAFLEELGINCDTEILHQLQRERKKVVVLATKEGPKAFFGIQDPLQEKSQEAVEALKKQHCEVILLTEEEVAAAEALASSVGIKKYFANLLPSQKAELLASFKKEGKRVAIVGNGLYDAADFCQTEVSFSLGAGTEVALEAAPITLLSQDLSLVHQAIDLVKITLRKIRQNLTVAFMYNLFALSLAITGIVNPLLALFTMTLSCLFVMGNCLLLFLWKK